jgi:tetratricopeptide (TPR) repeat protein
VKITSIAVCSALVLGLGPACAPAQEQHHHPGEAGSAQQVGKVSFPTSCRPEVQASFERGVAMLHSFWFTVGERTFREVLERDPGCAIAGWGIAAVLIGNTFVNNPGPQDSQRAREAIARARDIGAKSERERLYIEAIAQYYDRFAERPPAARMKSLADAFSVLAKRFPQDDEAQVFSALYLTSTQDPSDKDFKAALGAAAMLEQQFKKHPDHPGVAHYLIHSYDFPPIAQEGLRAARAYASIAPSAPHALHMPSHIFTRVGAWEDSIRTNVRSAEASRAEKEPGAGVHAIDYMVYAYMQLAQDRAAREAIELSQRITGVAAGAVAAYATASMPARYAVERGAWKEAAQLRPAGAGLAHTAAITHFARALGAARSGDPDAAAKDVQELARLAESIKSRDPYGANEIEVQRRAAAAWTAYARGSREEAHALMRSAADLEDTSEKHAVTPGRLLPARELLGEMLLESGRHRDALVEFEQSQKRDPNRFRGLYGAGQAAAQAGERGKARDYFGRLVANARSGDARPELQQARAYLGNP